MSAAPGVNPEIVRGRPRTIYRLGMKSALSSSLSASWLNRLVPSTSHERPRAPAGDGLFVSDLVESREGRAESDAFITLAAITSVTTRDVSSAS